LFRRVREAVAEPSKGGDLPLELLPTLTPRSSGGIMVYVVDPQVLSGESARRVVGLLEEVAQARFDSTEYGEDEVAVVQSIRDAAAADQFYSKACGDIDLEFVATCRRLGWSAATVEVEHSIPTPNRKLSSITSAALSFTTLRFAEPAKILLGQQIARLAYGSARIARQGPGAAALSAGQAILDPRLALWQRSLEDIGRWTDRLPYPAGLRAAWFNMLVSSCTDESKFAEQICASLTALRNFATASASAADKRL
jgi:hypothetical protein